MANFNYRGALTVNEIKEYIGNSRLVSFDYETAPDTEFRSEDKAALDAHKSHIVGCSFSVKPYTGIYVPVAHLNGNNINSNEFFRFLEEFLTDTKITKIAHNIAFESAVSYHRGIVIKAPVYDTICAAQLTLKSGYEFRKLSDSGLKDLAVEMFHEPLPSFSDVTDGRNFDELDAQDAETIRYGSADSDYALRLYYKFNNWFDKYMPKHRFITEKIESPTAVYLGIMKYNGVPIDYPLMLRRGREVETQMNILRNDIRKKAILCLFSSRTPVSFPNQRHTAATAFMTNTNITAPKVVCSRTVRQTSTKKSRTIFLQSHESKTL